MDTDILIVGGGLAGLRLADLCQQAGREYLLVDARDRFGGRVASVDVGGAAFDLGPAWFWPGQPRIAALISRFGLQRFEQFCDGLLTVEDETGQVQKGRGYASMQGSFRLAGGLQHLIDTLAATIPDPRKRLDTHVTELRQLESGVQAGCADGFKISARSVVLALPPRVAAERIAFSPALPDAAMMALRQIPTWMAGQAKALAVYDRPFWRDAGLSGDAMSRVGPMVELHDASPQTGGPFALFGFIGVPPEGRRDANALKNACKAQLTRLFGADAANPSTFVLRDWARDPHTATPLDFRPVHTHPRYCHPAALMDIWGGTLGFSGTELAPQFGGYLEGALESAEITWGTMAQNTGAE